jgi:hypothetical protein
MHDARGTTRLFVVFLGARYELKVAEIPESHAIERKRLCLNELSLRAIAKSCEHCEVLSLPSRITS